MVSVTSVTYAYFALFANDNSIVGISGGTEVAGVDYFIARKILRKFEQLNISYIRDEIDGFIEFLDTTFGKGEMKECEEYLLRLKKLT